MQREQAIATAERAFALAEREHQKKVKKIDEDRASVDERSKTESARWETQKRKLDQSTFADLPSVLPDIRCPHCPKPHQLSDVTAWLAEESVEQTGSLPAKLPHPRASA